ncbi:hypothetical protein [Nocardioides sp.]|uniref:hypothetical protein n=1 Tax=Nocardioides sp. TaxID=35761 RepID=UPI0025F638BC|nr:hypothetical protein [Nocardioides sp.]
MAQAAPEPDLESLSRRIREARTAVERHRHQKAAAGELAEARHQLTLALEAYAAALERKNLPMPWRLQAELRLHRDLFDR